MSDAEREEACAAAPVPTTIFAELDRYEWARDTVKKHPAEEKTWHYSS